MLNPFRKSPKPFEEPKPKPVQRKYPCVLLEAGERRIVMPDNHTFVIEHKITTRDAMGQPSTGWLDDYTIKNVNKSYDRDVKPDIVYWILSELADAL